jgi:hypothetical protein
MRRGVANGEAGECIGGQRVRRGHNETRGMSSLTEELCGRRCRGARERPRMGYPQRQVSFPPRHAQLVALDVDGASAPVGEGGSVERGSVSAYPPFSAHQGHVLNAVGAGRAFPWVQAQLACPAAGPFPYGMQQCDRPPPTHTPQSSAPVAPQPDRPTQVCAPEAPRPLFRNTHNHASAPIARYGTGRSGTHCPCWPPAPPPPPPQPR